MQQLENDLGDPAFEKDGNLLADQLRRRLKRLVQTDRAGVVEALREWLEAREMLRTIQAVVLVRDVGLVELLPLVRQLRQEVGEGRTLRPSVLYLFDAALDAVKG